MYLIAKKIFCQTYCDNLMKYNFFNIVFIRIFFVDINYLIACKPTCFMIKFVMLYHMILFLYLIRGGIPL